MSSSTYSAFFCEWLDFFDFDTEQRNIYLKFEFVSNSPKEIGNITQVDVFKQYFKCYWEHSLNKKRLVVFCYEDWNNSFGR